MRQYDILNPIKIDGHTRRGGRVGLSDAEGALLIRQGFVRLVAGEMSPDTTEAVDPPPSPANETGAVTDAPAPPETATPAAPATPVKRARTRKSGG